MRMVSFIVSGGEPNLNVPDGRIHQIPAAGKDGHVFNFCLFHN